MGRRVPNDNISLIEQLVYFSFSFVGLAASIVIITTLCSIFGRKKAPSPPASPHDPFETKALNASTPPSTMEAAAMVSPELPRMSEARKSDFTIDIDNNDLLTKELPLPPAMLVPKESNVSYSMKRETSDRRMSFNFSMKAPRSFSIAKNQEDNDGGRKGKLKTDESVWMKTIILGDKCVPDEEEDAIMYEGKGKRISFSAYHPRKSTSSVSLSRQCSFIDPDALAASQAQFLEERIK